MRNLRLALAAGGLLLAVPALSSCGFDYPTERVNTVGAGVTDHDAKVDIGSALIVAGQPDSGTLIGSLANNTEDPISLTSMTGGEKGSITADQRDAIEVPGQGHVNLATLARDGDGLTVSGDFDAGDFVTITLTFDNNESVTMEIPVMKPCYQFEGLDNTSKEPSTEALYQCGPADDVAPAEH